MIQKKLLKNQGFVPPEEITLDQFVLGVGAIPTEALQKDRNWTPFLPKVEDQNKFGVETYNCSAFGTTNPIEILHRRKYSEEPNYSDRFLGLMAETAPPGNNPHLVCEVVRKIGLVKEASLPFDDSINSVGKYYAPKPAPEALLSEAVSFVADYDFKHEWVWSNINLPLADKQVALFEALQYSPVSVAVLAWKYRNGIAFKEIGEVDTHWVTLVHAEWGRFWDIFDSYDGYVKRCEWNYDFGYAKRYHLAKRGTIEEKRIGILQILIERIREFWGAFNRAPEMTWVAIPEPVAPLPVPEPAPAPKTGFLEKFCLAIRDYEGSPGDLNYRNNNPGNAKYYSGGYHSMYGVVRKDSKGFAIFRDYATGWLYLQNMIKGKIKKNPERTIREFFYEYAPVEDANDPEAYARFVAKRLGVTVDFNIKNLL